MGTGNQQALKPAIPAEEVTPDVVRDGVTIALGNRDVFWKTDSGSVSLNAFTGDISTKVAGRGLSDMDVMAIVNGVRSGRIMIVDKLIKGDPVDTTLLTSEYAPGARKLLDYNDGEFREAVESNFSIKLLKTALSLEKSGANRKERIKLLGDKLLDIMESR